MAPSPADRRSRNTGTTSVMHGISPVVARATGGRRSRGPSAAAAADRIDGGLFVLKCFDVQPHRTRPQLRLAREADERWLQVEHVEQIELVLGGRQQILRALEDVNPTGSATRAPAVERNRCVMLVAEIDQGGAVRRVDLHDAP